MAALAAALAVAATLGGCSGAGLLNALQPRSALSIVRDVPYRSGPRGTLDIYRPSGADGQTPVLVFIYGGSWDSGSRSQYAFVGKALAAQGFLTLIPDYRLYPQVRWPTFLQDNAQAVRWARDHAAEYGGDAHELFLMGHSAGAYDVAMLALDARWLAAVGMNPRRSLRGVVALAGPYDFLPLKSRTLQSIFGPPQGRGATQPIHYVDGHNPPLFLATDTDDRFVEPGNTTRLAARVRAAGGPVEVHYYRGLSHGLLLGVLATPLRFLAPVRHDVVQFLRSHLAAGAEAAGRVAPSGVVTARPPGQS